MFEVIAMASMLIDHIGRAFFPSTMEFTIIGRLALPLYTYGIVQGFTFTHNFHKYLFRLLFIALISQVFFTLLFKTFQLNIIFTYVIALLLFAFYRKFQINIFLTICLTLIAAVLLTIFRFEAGWYTLFLALIYYKKQYLLLSHIILNIVTVMLFWNMAGWLQMVSLVGTVIIVFMKNVRLKGTRRNLYRIFYPSHLAVLAVIKALTG